jgi:hypothetical protein
MKQRERLIGSLGFGQTIASIITAHIGQGLGHDVLSFVKSIRGQLLLA